MKFYPSHNLFLFISFVNFIVGQGINQQEIKGRISETTELCYDHYPTYKQNGVNSIIKPNRCNEPKPIVAKSILTQQKQSYTAFKGNHTMITREDAKVQVYLACASKTGLCEKVEKAFTTTASFLENIIEFKQPILIRASFFPFCEAIGQCPNDNSFIVGQAGPLRSLPVSDENGIIRLYPQALHKQVVSQNNNTVKYSQYDIFAEFNSEATYYFPDDNKPKRKGDTNFLDVISHEIMHGLGIATSINDYFNTGQVTFYPDYQINNDTEDINKTKVNFMEFIFDKFITISKPDNFVVQYLSKYNENNLVENDNPLKEGSKLLNISIELTKEVTIKNNIFFQVNPDTLITLESSLSPYISGSSIAHLDKAKYLNTADSLMCYRIEDKDLSQIIKDIGAWNTAPYGPNLLAILEKLGYTLNKNPSQEHSYTKLYRSNAYFNLINYVTIISIILICLIFS